MNKLSIGANGRIFYNHTELGFTVRQESKRTLVYNVRKDVYLDLPRSRYSLAHPAPASGVAGSEEFERDFLTAIGLRP
jgi:hypothetical protein